MVLSCKLLFGAQQKVNSLSVFWFQLQCDNLLFVLNHYYYYFLFLFFLLLVGFISQTIIKILIIAAQLESVSLPQLN